MENKYQWCIAGVPGEVVKRAKEILSEIEKEGHTALKIQKESSFDLQVDMFAALSNSKESEACDKIRATDINTMTPIEAMNLLFEIKKILS